MKRKVITTADGSSSISMCEWGETYHSIHGAIQESKHVYLKEGFNQFSTANLSVLEMGFGTGLNAFLTSIEANLRNINVCYHAVEGFPLTPSEINSLNYAEQFIEPNIKEDFNKIVSVDWEQEFNINDNFRLKKIKCLFEDLKLNQTYNLIYFDVFGYNYQPELWSEEIFKKMYDALLPNGILVTYACRGPIKRAMKQVGFTIDRIPGPPGKREMIRAYKK